MLAVDQGMWFERLVVIIPPATLELRSGVRILAVLVLLVEGSDGHTEAHVLRAGRVEGWRVVGREVGLGVGSVEGGMW